MPARNKKGQFIKGSKKNYTGVKVGRLTFVSFSRMHTQPSGKEVPYWFCLCDCGKRKEVAVKDVIGGKTRSCGCLQKEKASAAQTVHGESDTPLHLIWQNMKRRCYEKTNGKYKNYGGRGIRVCKEWKDNYSAFANWSRANGYEDGLTIERINVDDDYKPSNCEWVRPAEQSRNKTVTHYHTIHGETYQTMEDVSDAFDIDAKTLYSRFYRGDRGDDLVRPVGQRRFWKKTPR